MQAVFSFVQALFALARAIEHLASALQPWPGSMADQASPPTLTVTIQPEAMGGSAMQEYATNDAQQLSISNFAPSVKTKGGNTFKNADGSDLTPDQLTVSWSTDKPEVSQLDMAADGRSGKIKSGTAGRAIVSAAVAGYPDGSTKSWSFGHTVGFSEAGEPTIDVVIEDEPA